MASGCQRWTDENRHPGSVQRDGADGEKIGMNEIPTAGPVAAHTVERLLRSFDHHDPQTGEGMPDLMRAARAECPVFRSEMYGGFWVVTRHADVCAVAKDHTTYSSAGGVGIPAVTVPRPLIPIEIDPPAQQKYRRLVNPLFAPKAVGALEDDLRALARRLVEDLVAAGEGDFIDGFAKPLPAIIVLRILGFPESEWRQFLGWVHTVVHEMATDVDVAVEAALSLYGYLAEVLEDRRERRQAGLDIVSRLLDAEIDGDRLSEEEILDFCFLLLTGGLDTTTAALGHALHFLAEHPDQRARLEAHLSQVPVCAEEFIRHASPVQAVARTVTRDSELAGQKLSKGDRLLLLWGSANRDQDVFPDADQILPDRLPNPHVAFGIGVHRCVGMYLARLTLRVGLEEVLQQAGPFRIKPGGSVAHYADIGVIAAITALPVVFDRKSSLDEASGAPASPV